MIHKHTHAWPKRLFSHHFPTPYASACYVNLLILINFSNCPSYHLNSMNIVFLAVCVAFIGTVSMLMLIPIHYMLFFLKLHLIIWQTFFPVVFTYSPFHINSNSSVVHVHFHKMVCMKNEGEIINQVWIYKWLTI